MPGLRIGDAQVQEGAPGNAGALVVPVTLSVSTASTVSAHFATSEGTAHESDDYVGDDRNRHLPSRRNDRVVDTPHRRRDRRGRRAHFFIDLSQPTHASLEDAQAIATIVNDNTTPAVSISIPRSSKDRVPTEATLDLSLSAPVGRIVSVSFLTSDGTATAGEDFTANSGTVIFSPGQVSRPITVDISGDGAGEPDKEFFVTSPIR